MSPRAPKKIAKSKDDALAAFVAKKAEIDAMLTRLQALSEITSTTAPTRSPGLTSAPLEHHADLLKRITDMAFKEGAHAA